MEQITENFWRSSGGLQNSLAWDFAEQLLIIGFENKNRLFHSMNHHRTMPQNIATFSREYTKTVFDAKKQSKRLSNRRNRTKRSGNIFRCYFKTKIDNFDLIMVYI